MTHTTPLVRPWQNGFRLNLSCATGAETASLALEGPDWFDWLQQHRAFRFESAEGSFSARRERRPGGWYWYASRRIRGTLHIVYLGRTPALDVQRLVEVARELASKGEPPECRALTPASTQMSVAEHPLLLTKLTVPGQRVGLLPRPHLVTRLEQCHHYKLTLLCTPAGFGKTTLLGEWLRQTSAAVAWLSLDEQDNDLIRFWRYLLAALGQHQPALNASIVPLLRQVDGSTIQVALVLLLNELATLSQELCLVLDDYHLIHVPEIHHSLTFLLEHLPAHVHLLIASRAEPPLPLARLRAADALLELPVTSLRFTEDETLALLRQTTELPVEAMQALAAHTEGWIIGLQLAISSLRHHADGTQFITSFTGTSRHLVDYLISEVLRGLPADQFAFLVRTSVLSRLHASLCDAVLAQQHSQAMLERLEQSQLFLFPLDDVRRWYRYHPLFAEMLSQHLATREPELIPQVQRRAAAWCAAHDLTDEAIGYALAARDFASAVHVLESSAEATLLSGESHTVQRWLDALPELLLRSNPLLCCLYALVLLAHSQFTAVEARLQDAERAIQQAQLPEQEAATRRVRAMIEVARSTVAINLGDPEESMAYAQRALDLLEQDDLVLRSVVLHNLAAAQAVGDDLEEAIKVYRQAIAVSCQRGYLLIAVTSLGSLAHLQARQGKTREARETCQHALRLSRTQPDRPDLLLPPAGKAMLLLGRLLYEQHDLSDALTHTLKGIELSRCWMHQRHLIEGYLLLARVYQARGEGAAASEAAHTAVHLAEEARANEHPLRDWKLNALAAQAASTCAELGRLAPTVPPGQALSQRELAILRLLASGCSNRDIAAHLVLTTGTVKWYTHAIYSKLGVRSRTQAIAEARNQILL